MNAILNLKATFLEWVGVKKEEDAIRASINAAVGTRGGGKIYATGEERNRKEVRKEWERLILDESKRYRLEKVVSGEEHRDTISEIAEKLKSKCECYLDGGKLRFGVSAKAFNLYLKNLWCLGKIVVPQPHCTVDGVVLKKARIYESWGKCDDKTQYMDWVRKLEDAKPQDQSLLNWENEVWLDDSVEKHKQKQRHGGCTEKRLDIIADLYLLGKSLDQTVQTVQAIRRDTQKLIVRELGESYRRCSQCGLSNTSPGKQLGVLKSRVEGMQEAELEKDWRDDFKGELDAVIDGLRNEARSLKPLNPVIIAT